MFAAWDNAPVDRHGDPGIGQAELLQQLNHRQRFANGPFFTVDENLYHLSAFRTWQTRYNGEYFIANACRAHVGAGRPAPSTAQCRMNREVEAFISFGVCLGSLDNWCDKKPET